MVQGARRWLLVSATLLLFAACAEEDDFAYYFESKPYGVPQCDRPDPRLEGRRLVRLFTHRAVEVTDASRAMARYYRRYGFTFHTDRSAVLTEMPYAVDTDVKALEARLTQEFPGVDLNDEAALMRDPALYARVLKSAGNFMLRPMIEFAREHGLEGTHLTNIVALRDLVSPGGASFGPPGASPAGIAISPALIAALTAQGPDQAGAWPEVDFPAGFTPMLFLHGVLAGQLSGVEPAVRDLIAAHEFGHTAGLVHRETEGNLMAPFAVLGLTRCSDTLEDDQFATFRRGVGLDAPAQPLVAPPERAPPRAFPPGRFIAVLAGDSEALAALLAPVLHTFSR